MSLLTDAMAGHLITNTDGVLVSMALSAMALAIWSLEQWRRGATPAREVVDAAPSSASWLQTTGRQLLPELAGLAACSALALALICHGQHLGAPIQKGLDAQVWQDIQKDWPVLGTADTLLGLQAMLRLVVLASAMVRMPEAATSALAGEPALLLLLAGLVRGVLFALTPADIYQLDGPLGGWLNMAFEAAALVPLACLARFAAKIGAARLLSFLAGVSMAVVLALRNHLALGGDGKAHLDVLFSLVQLLELLAAGAFAARSLSSGGARGPFADLLHALMPPLQLLPVYFFLMAWPSDQALVGAGRPFELLQIGGAVQVGLYLCAAAMHFVLSSEEGKSTVVLPEQLLV